MSASETSPLKLSELLHERGLSNLRVWIRAEGKSTVMKDIELPLQDWDDPATRFDAIRSALHSEVDKLVEAMQETLGDEPWPPAPNRAERRRQAKTRRNH